jgi:ABC-type siderophore export system fused ATPase/permease subunit
MKSPVGGSSSLSATASPLAIVALVVILGSAAYLWRSGYIRSRAALIVLAAIVGVLIYLGFFAMQPPT